MTHKKFLTKWKAASAELDPVVRAFVASIPHYREEVALALHRAEMIGNVLEVLNKHNLPVDCDPEWAARHFAYYWETADDVITWFRYRALHSAGLTPGGGVYGKDVQVNGGYMPLVRINAPEWFAREDFMTWVNSNRTATWHTKPTVTRTHGGELMITAANMQAGDFSDVFFTWTGPYEGSDSPGGSEPHIPEDIWEYICERLWRMYGLDGEALVWVSNLK